MILFAKSRGLRPPNPPSPSLRPSMLAIVIVLNHVIAFHDPNPLFVMPLKLAVTKLRHITSKGELFRFCLKKRGAPPLTPPRFVMSSMLQFLITCMVFINFNHVSSFLIILIVSCFFINLSFHYFSHFTRFPIFVSHFQYSYHLHCHYVVSFFFIIFDYLDDFSSFSSFLSVHHLSCFLHQFSIVSRLKS